MGYVGVSYQISALLDEHGGEKELRDRSLWEDLTTRIAEIAREKKYEEIVVAMYDNER